jgi:hypothetical protein
MNIVNAAVEYASQLRVTDSEHAAFIAGAEYADARWREKTRWVPVEERLPSTSSEVLLKFKDGMTVVAVIHNNADMSFVKKWKLID